MLVEGVETLMDALQVALHLGLLVTPATFRKFYGLTAIDERTPEQHGAQLLSLECGNQSQKAQRLRDPRFMF